MRKPTDNWNDWYIAQGFGAKTSYGYHDGADINLKTGGNSDLGEPLYAISDYEVTSVHTNHPNKGFGNHIHIKIKGDWGVRYCHYAHCKDIFVKRGDTGKEGDKIATVGNTGNSTFAHLHFAIKKKPAGIENVANTKAELDEFWEAPIAFIEKWMKKNSDLSICLQQHDKLVKEAIAKDKTIDELEETNKKVKEEKQGCENQKLDTLRQLAEKLDTIPEFPEIMGKIEGLLGMESELTDMTKREKDHFVEIERLNGVIKANLATATQQKKELTAEIDKRGRQIEVLQKKPVTTPVSTRRAEPLGGASERRVLIDKPKHLTVYGIVVLLLLIIDILKGFLW